MPTPKIERRVTGERAAHPLHPAKNSRHRAIQMAQRGQLPGLTADEGAYYACEEHCTVAMTAISTYGRCWHRCPFFH